MIFFGGGCIATPPGGMLLPDLGVDASLKLMAPILTEVPSSTPNATVAFRGRSQGARIIVQVPGITSLEGAAYPTGDFCIEAPVPAQKTTTYSLMAIDSQGKLSPSVDVAVTHDPKAAQPKNPVCGDPGMLCANAENCSNGKDDNCNGLIDHCDPACNSCLDDKLEPNDDPFAAPMVPNGYYQELAICPCRPDWYAFKLDTGSAFYARVVFQKSANFDIDLKFYRSADALKLNDNWIYWRHLGNGLREVDFVADKNDTYYLEVFNKTGAEVAGSYQMQLLY